MVKGRKHHILIDTIGSVVAAIVYTPDVEDRMAPRLSRCLSLAAPRLCRYRLCRPQTAGNPGETRQLVGRETLPQTEVSGFFGMQELSKRGCRRVCTCDGAWDVARPFQHRGPHGPL